MEIYFVFLAMNLVIQKQIKRGIQILKVYKLSIDLEVENV